MPSISGARTILLKANRSLSSAHEEGPAAAVISPGMHVVMTTAAGVFQRDTYTPGATPASGTTPATPTVEALVRVAMEDSLQGKTVNDAYASGDNVFVHQCLPGEIVQVLVAAAQTVVKGDGGKAIASGKWNVSATDKVVEFLEASGGVLAADTLMRARVL